MHCLITGAGGFLGGVVLNRLLQTPQITVTALRFDPTRARVAGSVNEIHVPTPWTHEGLMKALPGTPPTHILHIGALSSPEACERSPKEAETYNVGCTKALLEYAGYIGAHVTFVSTDLVFDGAIAAGDRFRPEDLPSPLSVYARTKRAAEELVLESGRGAVVRSSLIYGHSPSPSKGALGWMERSFREGSPLRLFYDEFRTPIHVEDLSTILRLISRLRLLGLWHCGGPDRMSRVEFGEAVAESLGYGTQSIVPVSRSDAESLPARPEDVSLDSSRLIAATGISPLDVRSALATYLEWR